jgi:hypothetical protein
MGDNSAEPAALQDAGLRADGNRRSVGTSRSECSSRGKSPPARIGTTAERYRGQDLSISRSPTVNGGPGRRTDRRAGSCSGLELVGRSRHATDPRKRQVSETDTSHIEDDRETDTFTHRRKRRAGARPSDHVAVGPRPMAIRRAVGLLRVSTSHVRTRPLAPARGRTRRRDS